MEPWPFSHGNSPLAAASSSRWYSLQWSHGPLAMETLTVTSAPVLLASLQWSHGPLAMETHAAEMYWYGNKALQWSHGPLAMETCQQLHHVFCPVQPSMEPWPFSHGNDDYVMSRIRHPNTLQWSHGPLAMETGMVINFIQTIQILQWSHGPLAMETT